MKSIAIACYHPFHRRQQKSDHKKVADILARSSFQSPHFASPSESSSISREKVVTLCSLHLGTWVVVAAACRRVYFQSVHFEPVIHTGMDPAYYPVYAETEIVDSEWVVVYPPSGKSCPSHGTASHVYVTPESSFVSRRPNSLVGPEDDVDGDWSTFRELVGKERQICERVGNHEGVVGYRDIFDQDSGAIERLACASGGGLTEFINNKPMPDLETRSQMIRRVCEGLLYLHSRNIAVQDIKTDNVLVHHGCTPKIFAFDRSILYPLTENMRDVCPKEVLQRDLLGMGCVLYFTWDVFNYDLDERERWPIWCDLKPTASVKFGSIIDKCWYGEYTSIEEFYSDVIRVDIE